MVHTFNLCTGEAEAGAGDLCQFDRFKSQGYMVTPCLKNIFINHFRVGLIGNVDFVNNIALMYENESLNNFSFKKPIKLQSEAIYLIN